MKNYRLLIVSFIFFLSCKKNTTRHITSDLTFKSVSFANMYGATDEQYNNFLKEIDSVLKVNKNVKSDIVKLYNRYLKLKEYGILRAPYIYLNPEKDSVIVVYLDEKEYKKVKNLNQRELFKEKKKIIIELEIEEKENDIFYSNNIISVSRVDGKSRSNITH